MNYIVKILKEKKSSVTKLLHDLTRKKWLFRLSKGKYLIFHGTADTAVTMDEFANLAKELEKHGLSHEMISYGKAPHAFTVWGNPSYREDADKNSWRRFTEFLANIALVK